MTQWQNIIKPNKGEIRAIIPIEGLTDDNAYVEVADLDTRWLTDTNIIISVTTNSLDYKIDVYNDYVNGVAYTKSTDTIAKDAQKEVVLARHARVKISIKPTASGVHGNYQVDIIAGR